jgi:DNA-binding NtrC family response regulator
METVQMKRILVIDDDAKIRSIYNRFLTDEGFEVIEAKDAREGTFKMIRIGRPVDVVLLDINMPEVDGCYMRQIIEEWDPNLKIIISSVYPLDEQKKMIPNAAEYYDKAQGTKILLKKINKVFEYV